MKTKRIAGLVLTLVLLAVIAVVGLGSQTGAAASGEVVAWGDNSYGQCDVPTPDTALVAISAGMYHSLGLKSDGSVVAWGNNDFGQCDVPPNTGFMAIAAGETHNLGLTSDNSVVAWGDDSFGQCDVPPGKDFVAISAGARHSLGLKSDGSVFAWGSPESGELDVPPNTVFKAIAAGWYYSLGLKSTGEVVAWGDNSFGQWNVPLPNSGFVAISAGAGYGLALKSDRSVVAWGANDQGQCNVPLPNRGFMAIAAGAMHGLAVREVVVFPDHNLEAAIRDAIKKPSGNIYQSDLDLLTTLNAARCGIADLTGLGHCVNLQILSLGGNQIGAIGATELAKLANLRSLTLDDGNQIGPSGAAELAKLTNLQSLSLGGNRIGDVGATELAKLVNLRFLTLGANEIGDVGATELAKLVNLQDLRISYNQIGPSGATELAKLVNLKFLELSVNQIGPTGATELAKLVNLQTLYLASNQIGDRGATELAKLTNLQTLNLDSNQIGDRGATELAKLTHLQYLYLDVNQIGDSGATELAKLTNLRWLWLSVNQIGDSGARELAKLTNLQDLRLYYNQIGDISALASSGALPKLQYLELRCNYLDITPLSPTMQDIQTLVGRGVDVRHDPQRFGYTLTIAVTGHGTTNPAQGAHRYASGAVVNLSATPAPVSLFVNWTGDVGNSTNASTTVTMNGNKTVTANFAPAEVWVNAAWASHSPGDVLDGHTYWYDAFPSIWRGISAVAPHGTVHVAAGQYNERITLRDGVTVQGAGAAVTTIDGYNQGNGPVVWASGVGSTAKLDGFTITSGLGGGMYNYNSSPTVSNCIFSHNTEIGGGGGGMWNDSSSPKVTNCTFSYNQATCGGGMRNQNQSSPTVINCTFLSNIGSSYGGGMYNSSSSPIVTNCTFKSNASNSKAWGYGGAMYNDSSSPKVTNCIFWDNNANRGGGMCNVYSSPTVTNCTFYANHVYIPYTSVGGIENRGSSSPAFTNCILWGNSPREIYNSGSTPVVTNCDVQGGYGGTGTNNISWDPLFFEGGLFLRPGSPCIDTGINGAIQATGVSTDCAGRARIVDGDNAGAVTVDMGAYEYQGGVPQEGQLTLPSRVVWPLTLDSKWTIRVLCPVDIMVTDPDGLVISKDMNQIPGATYTETDLNGDGDLDAVVEIPQSKAGEYRIAVIPKPGADPNATFTLDVSDGSSTAILGQDIPVGNQPVDCLYSATQPPVAEAGGPYMGDEGSPIALDASSSYDPDTTIVLYEWNLDGDGVFEVNSASPTAQHTWSDDFTGIVTVRVTDNDGLTDTDTAQVTVSNVAPALEAGPDQTVEVFNLVSFNGSFVDPGSLDTHTMVWDFGDGTGATGTLTPAHAYTLVGNYTVTLTVTDDDGGVGTGTLTVQVIQKYAIWANSSAGSAISWSGSGATITGKVHSNAGVAMSGSNNTINGTAYYVSKFTVTGSSDHCTALQQLSTPRPMPVYYALADYQPGGTRAVQAQAGGKYHYVNGNFNVSTSGTLLDGLYYVKGNVNLSGSNIKGTFTIVAEGTISISGSGMNGTAYSGDLLFFSNGASLNISGSNSTLGGIIYVPNGKINISGSGGTINGSLFASQVAVSGSNMKITAV